MVRARPAHCTAPLPRRLAPPLVLTRPPRPSLGSGILWKHTGQTSAPIGTSGFFERLFFRLDGDANVLSFYATEGPHAQSAIPNQRPVGSIPLSGGAVSTFSHSLREWSFIVDVPAPPAKKPAYLLAGENEAERVQWMAALSRRGLTPLEPEERWEAQQQRSLLEENEESEEGGGGGRGRSGSLMSALLGGGRRRRASESKLQEEARRLKEAGGTSPAEAKARRDSKRDLWQSVEEQARQSGQDEARHRSSSRKDVELAPLEGVTAEPRRRLSRHSRGDADGADSSPSKDGGGGFESPRPQGSWIKRGSTWTQLNAGGSNPSVLRGSSSRLGGLLSPRGGGAGTSRGGEGAYAHSYAHASPRPGSAALLSPRGSAEASAVDRDSRPIAVDAVGAMPPMGSLGVLGVPKLGLGLSGLGGGGGSTLGSRSGWGEAEPEEQPSFGAARRSLDERMTAAGLGAVCEGSDEIQPAEPSPSSSGGGASARPYWQMRRLSSGVTERVQHDWLAAEMMRAAGEELSFNSSRRDTLADATQAEGSHGGSDVRENESSAVAREAIWQQKERELRGKAEAQLAAQLEEQNERDTARVAAAIEQVEAESPWGGSSTIKRQGSSGASIALVGGGLKSSCSGVSLQASSGKSAADGDDGSAAMGRADSLMSSSSTFSRNASSMKGKGSVAYAACSSPRGGGGAAEDEASYAASPRSQLLHSISSFKQGKQGKRAGVKTETPRPDAAAEWREQLRRTKASVSLQAAERGRAARSAVRKARAAGAARGVGGLAASAPLVRLSSRSGGSLGSAYGACGGVVGRGRAMTEADSSALYEKEKEACGMGGMASMVSFSRGTALGAEGFAGGGRSRAMTSQAFSSYGSVKMVEVEALEAEVEAEALAEAERAEEAAAELLDVPEANMARRSRGVSLLKLAGASSTDVAVASAEGEEGGAASGRSGANKSLDDDFLELSAVQRATALLGRLASRDLAAAKAQEALAQIAQIVETPPSLPPPSRRRPRPSAERLLAEGHGCWAQLASTRHSSDADASLAPNWYQQILRAAGATALVSGTSVDSAASSAPDGAAAAEVSGREARLDLLWERTETRAACCLQRGWRVRGNRASMQVRRTRAHA